MCVEDERGFRQPQLHNLQNQSAIWSLAADAAITTQKRSLGYRRAVPAAAEEAEINVILPFLFKLHHCSALYFILPCTFI